MKFNKISMCLRPFLNVLSLFFLGILFFGLMSCSSATVSTSPSPSSPTEDKTPPNVAISTNESLEIGKTGTITFTFSEKVTNFTPDEIQLLVNGVNVDKGKFVTNNQESYSFHITPTAIGNLYVSIPANSFYDLSSNQNTNNFSTNFLVEDKTPPTVTISTNESLAIDINGTITFTFNEKVNNFTQDDIQLLLNGVNVDNGKFVTNNQESYSFHITPTAIGNLYVSIPANSFYDLSSNKNTNNFSTNFWVRENIPPTVTISTNESLAIDINGTITFTFNEKVNNFTQDDIQLLPTGFSLDKGKFVTNNEKSYSLQITPKEEGTLYVSIPAKSFQDLSGNQNDKPYSSGFAIFHSGATIHTISFKLNGGSFIFPQITNLKVVSNTAIEETRLGRILSYPPTGPKPSINAVTRDVSEWRNNDGTTYDFSTLVTSDLTLEAVWSNSCGKVETFHPANKNEIQNYINTAVGANPIPPRYSSPLKTFNYASIGANTNLNHIDTSAITDMTELFNEKYSFNGEIGCWNTANVNNMRSMFKKATAFNQDINSWNVGNVTDMWGMFSYATAFNQDIGSWNVANVNNMYGMFNQAWAFNQDISTWNVGNVTNMWGMFSYASYFNQDIGGWNVSNVTDMDGMFYNADSFDQDISKWTVSNVTKHDKMFTRSAMATKTNQHPTFP